MYSLIYFVSNSIYSSIYLSVIHPCLTSSQFISTKKNDQEHPEMLMEMPNVTQSSKQLRDARHASNERHEDHDHIPAVDVGVGVTFHPPSDQHVATEPEGQRIETGHGKVLEAPEAANPQQSQRVNDMKNAGLKHAETVEDC